MISLVFIQVKKNNMFNLRIIPSDKKFVIWNIKIQFFQLLDSILNSSLDGVLFCCELVNELVYLILCFHREEPENKFLCKNFMLKKFKIIILIELISPENWDKYWIEYFLFLVYLNMKSMFKYTVCNNFENLAFFSTTNKSQMIRIWSCGFYSETFKEIHHW